MGLALVLMAAAPALAQVTSEVEGDDNDTSTAQYVDCSQVAFAVQTQYGDADAIATDDSTAIAEIVSEQGITVNQANACLGEIDLNDDGVVEVVEIVEVVQSGGASAAAEATAAGSASASAAGSASAVAGVTELPETGGAGLLALGAGVMLVGGGLVARGMMRK